jgi:NAD(P)-dependent dehydrogenase (short-subunit alcohol dehydrogenase family)
MEAFARKEGVELSILDIDVTDEKSVNEGVDEAIRSSGRIDVLINNAGVLYAGVTEAFSLDQVQKQLDTNFFASMRTSRAVLTHMRTQKAGLLIQISSLMGRCVIPFFGIYCAAKHAVEALSEAYRYELYPFGIDSVIIEPGPIKTSIFASSSRGEDIHVVGNYGDLVSIPDGLINAFVDMGGDPGEVTEAIRRLIPMKHGERPIRTIVSGNDFGLQAVNDTAAPVQRGIIEAMGLGCMLPPSDV